VNLPEHQKTNIEDKDLEKVEYGLWETNELLKGYFAVGISSTRYKGCSSWAVSDYLTGLW